jgi:lipoprotein-anchoring transpeptidase ErfK/SrfK
MRLRAAATITVLLLGFAGTPALAQFLPLPIPPFQRPPFQPPPPVEAEEDVPPYDPPPGYRRAPPPPGTYASPQAAPQYGRGGPQEVETNTLPPPSGYRQPVPGYEPIDPPSRVARPEYNDPPPGYEPDPRSRIARPNYSDQPPPAYEQDPQTQPQPGMLPSPLDILRPPAAVGRQPEPVGRQPEPVGRQPEQAGRPPEGAVYAALPPEERPETGPRKELAPNLRRTLVDYRSREPTGTLVIDTANTYLYLVLGNGKAMRYGIGVGRDGFTWSGAERVSRMAEWPDWHPPAEMIERQPYLPRFMAGGEGNPLGARALYLGKTLYRIHGTNQPSTIGTFVSSGCIRLTNDDIMDLYQRVNVGTRVVVLPGRPPASANAAPEQPPGPYNPLAPPRPR